MEVILTKSERFDYLNSGKPQRITQVCLLDWASYWTTAGLDSITDALQKAQTKEAIRLILSDLGTMTTKVSRLVIGDEAIAAAEPDAVTEAMINTAVVSIMAQKLAWLTGIEELEEE